MKRGILIATALFLGLGGALGSPVQAAKPARKKQVLFFTKSAGFEHSAIRKTGAEPSFAEKIMKELADKNGYEVTESKDGSVFTPEGIAKYDSFVFYTTGNLTQPGTDKMPPMPAGGKEALIEAVRRGKGFVGIHSAADTFHSPGGSFEADGDKTDPYIVMLGGEFIRHGQQQPGHLMNLDPKFPGAASLADGTPLNEEWYSLKNLNKDMHVVMALATWSMKNTGGDSCYRRPPYPVVWARMHGKGRVFYSALGHRDDVWTNPAFQSLLVGGIKWSLGEGHPSLKSNAASVAPGFDLLPPNDPPPPRPDKPAPAKPTAAVAAPAK